jgi:NADP-dependent 3-hydroxy acid dehydrogenase YdfG
MIDAGQGDLIFVSSEAVGAIPWPWMSAYSASKHALEAWTGVLRAELEGTGLRVFVVRPGPTYTEQGAGWNVDDMQEMLAVSEHQGVIRHSGAPQPDDVAGVIASTVDLPEHIHMRLVEVVPSIPRKVKVKKVEVKN